MKKQVFFFTLLLMSVLFLTTEPRSLHHEELCQRFYQSTCYKKVEIQDPTGTVRSDIEGEKATLRIYQEILEQHRNWSEQEIDEAFIHQIYTPEQNERIRAAYSWVQNSIVHFIDQQPSSIFSKTEKTILKTRLQKTKLQLPPPGSLYMDEPDLLTKNEAHYQRLSSSSEMRLRVGGAYVYIAKSWFNLVATLAHELSHSIDPCELRIANVWIPAYQRLTQCFLENNLIALHKNRFECGSHDQLSEVFADWMAAQIITETLAFYATEFDRHQILNAARNSVRDLCDPEDDHLEFDLEFHPSPKIRIQNIVGEHPKLRTLLGCSAGPDPRSKTKRYCMLTPLDQPDLPVRTK